MHVSDINDELTVPHWVRSNCLAGLESFRPVGLPHVLHCHIELVTSCLFCVEEDREVLIREQSLFDLKDKLACVYLLLRGLFN